MVMKKGIIAGALALAVSSVSFAQTAGTFTAGQPLSTVNEAGEPTRMSPNVKVFGSFRFAESCTFDPAKNLILAMNAGVGQDMQENDGYVSLLNPDGSVHTAKWIGNDRNGLVLNQPLGSAIAGGKLYVADIDHVRTFDLATGTPGDAWQVEGATGLNGIAVASDGTVYASNTRDPQRVYKVTPSGQSSVFLEGAPLLSPNGVAIDNSGNIVVINIGNNHVMTFNTAGELINTEYAAEGGNDGVVVLADGTKIVSSVRFGSISRIRPGQNAEVIAVGIPSAASICYDSIQNQIVIPMNNNNAMGFLPLD
jgi:hypothetical protein